MKVSLQADRQRVDQLRSADEAAWEELFREIYPAMVTYARRRLGTDQALDAASECMTRAIAGASRIPLDGCTAQAWVFGILRHVVIDQQRKIYRYRALMQRIPRIPFASEELQGEALIEADDQSDVRVAFSKLSLRDQEILELLVVAGLKAEEVSKILGVRSGTIRNVRYRALNRLRNHLENAGGMTP